MTKQKTQYDIHGTTISVPGECGLYKPRDGGKRWEYAILNPSGFIEAINSTTKHHAIGLVTALKDHAEDQVTWKRDSPDTGFRFVEVSRRQSFNDAQKNIKNTKRFAKAVLRALQGE